MLLLVDVSFSLGQKCKFGFWPVPRCSLVNLFTLMYAFSKPADSLIISLSNTQCFSTNWLIVKVRPIIDIEKQSACCFTMSVASKIFVFFQSEFCLCFQQFILDVSGSELYDIQSYVYVVNCSGANLMMMWCHVARNRKQLITIMVAMMMIWIWQWNTVPMPTCWCTSVIQSWRMCCRKWQRRTYHRRWDSAVRRSSRFLYHWTPKLCALTNQ